MRSRRDTIVSRIRCYGALAAVTALSSLAAIGPPGTARAATSPGTSYDQITGQGSTGSAVTVPWTQGLLDDSNQPIAAANAVRSNPSDPLSFMYAGNPADATNPGFKNLQVTVSQTQDITHQGITVSWTGGPPTVRSSAFAIQGNYLQMMECYGDSSSGPSPQDCEFGSSLVSNVGSAGTSGVDSRTGVLCALDSSGKTLPASTSNPPNGLDGSNPSSGCDPQEPVPGASPPDTSALFPQQYAVPFVPVSNPGSPAYSTVDLSQYFNKVTTNEVPQAVTNADGTGQVHFVAQTGVEAPGLGCGQLESSGQTRNCWLVIVPRGVFEPNGLKINTIFANSSLGYEVSSPLSATNWAMRIQVHLSYAPVPNFCDIGSNELLTVGTQVATRAVQSWQVALNQTTSCQTVYGFSDVPEATSTQQLAQGADQGGVGLAFTTIPIGSESARDGTPPVTGLPPIVYAPVAISALGFGFNVNESTGYIFTPVKLTPELMAKSLTQAYQYDLPDNYPNPTDGTISTPFLGPTATGQWANGNPINLSQDQMFQRINPEVPASNAPWSLAPLLTEDHSGLNQQVWQWLQGDPATVAWLDQGTTDSGNGVSNLYTVDPFYQKLQLGTAANLPDSFPRAYGPCLDAGPTLPQPGVPVKEITRCSLDLLPYIVNYDQIALNVLTANNQVGFQWNSTALAPDGTNGWWDKSGSEPVGQTFMWGMSDTPDLAVYGLIDAQLCDDAGNNCAGPTTASLTTAVNNAKPDRAGLLQVNPANPGVGGYPLTQVVYAAVATNQSAANLTADANLIAYAAGQGQTPGAAPGDLPPGYLPLPASLQSQATTVVSELLADASSAGSSGGTPSTSGNGTGTTLTPAGAGTALGGSPSAAAGITVTPPRAQLAAETTRPEPVGAIRWLLLAVVIAGAACAVAGTVLLSGGGARWLKRMRL